ncbi:hypothetical protein [Paraburkholderia sp. DHOC27]|uniref:hypothetical protein n=1 Tax=Paraburkholderia sp. DHOC27 TaxID=2303330 RepID=UPI000E3B9FA4|nr:hypothetical protein [Paraburkholderia sp. DHOC27]RFU45007.1 hypothetical protein D0B32_25005 [Paraburkholderia sp. DHOC27]
MKYLVFCVAAALTSSMCRADQKPVFGVWEQLVTASTEKNAEPVRMNFIFSDTEITRETTFSALSDSFDGSICCVKVDHLMPMTLKALLEKYKWDSDDVDHLKSIAGWRYIYEAKVVDSRLQNKNMRDLVSNMSGANDISPFYSAVVSGYPVLTKAGSGTYALNGAVVNFSSEYDENKNVMRYLFKSSGESVRLSEKPFPAE